MGMEKEKLTATIIRELQKKEEENKALMKLIQAIKKEESSEGLNDSQDNQSSQEPVITKKPI